MKKVVCTTIIGLVFSLGSGSWYGTNLAWASKIAFTSVHDGPLRHSGISVMNSDGTNIQHLTNNPGVNAHWPAWSPDGTRIAFRLAAFPSKLCLINPDGSDLTVLKENFLESGRFAWAPDGRRIAYGSTFFIFLLDIRTGAETEVWAHPVDGRTIRDISWAPDGHQLAFTAAVGNKGRDIYVINVDGTGKRQLTEHPAHDRAPAWSPDGQQIAFYSHRDGRDGVWLMDVDGGHLKRLTDGNYPSWSSTGTHIVFFRFHGGLNPISRIGVMDANGQNVKVLARGSYPSWEPANLAVNPIGKLSTTWGRVKSSGDMK